MADGVAASVCQVTRAARHVRELEGGAVEVQGWACWPGKPPSPMPVGVCQVIQLGCHTFGWPWGNLVKTL